MSDVTQKLTIQAEGAGLPETGVEVDLAIYGMAIVNGVRSESVARHPMILRSNDPFWDGESRVRDMEMV